MFIHVLKWHSANPPVVTLLLPSPAAAQAQCEGGGRFPAAPEDDQEPSVGPPPPGLPAHLHLLHLRGGGVLALRGPRGGPCRHRDRSLCTWSCTYSLLVHELIIPVNLSPTTRLYCLCSRREFFWHGFCFIVFHLLYEWVFGPLAIVQLLAMMGGN